MGLRLRSVRIDHTRVDFVQYPSLDFHSTIPRGLSGVEALTSMERKSNFEVESIQQSNLIAVGKSNNSPIQPFLEFCAC